MEEVRIYHVPLGGRAWWAFLIAWAFFGLFVWLFVEEPHLKGDVMMWFGLIVFGVMGLFFPFNTRLASAQESIEAEGLTMKPQAICDLLNRRVAGDINKSN